MKQSSNKSRFDEIARQITKKFSGKKIFATSSFQTQSIPLLHILSQIDTSIPVYFLNTGYHFPETLNFKTEVSQLLGLMVIDLYSSTPKNHQRDDQGNLLFTSDPDYCCYLNKVKSLEPILIEYDIWITGVRADQTTNRASFEMIDDGPFNTIRYHPMLNWTKEDILEYIEKHNLPRHPLDTEGYSSIGCMPCTGLVRQDDYDGRSGRWMGLNKMECGLHIDLVGKS